MVLGLGDALFGTESKSKTRKRPTLTTDQRNALDKVLQEELGNQPTGISERERGIVDEVLGQRPQQQELVGSAQERVGELLGSREEFDEFFRTNVEQPLTETFQEDIIPGIGRRFGGGGFFSSERRDAEEGAMEELAQELTAGRSKAAIETPLNAVGAMESVLGSQQGIDNVALEAAGFDRTTREQQRQRRLQALLEAIGTPAFENITTVTEGTEGSIGDLAQAAATAYAGHLAASDRRLKENIKQIGFILGIPLYTFRYIWSPILQVGHMADEVAKVRPDVVLEGPEGFLMVDYGKLYSGSL